MRLVLVVSGLAMAVGMTLAEPSCADPCGLVPPAFWAGAAGNQTPIKRIGVQKTYVFYRNNIETLALRPGFSGNVDEFGMLIPFPSPPAIRKLPDNVFEQIAAAIDPPEVVIDLRPGTGGFGGGGGGFFGGGGGLGGGGLRFVPKDQVRVIREEAVGMYEVAVLAAGSAQALKRWMDDHKYRFPSGMEDVCTDYIEKRWCFVAVKTKVKQKDAAQPRPGQRKVDDNLPAGSSFDGHVQAMGFRFRTRHLVVPMRLSVHNSGDLRNVVYLLADTPSRIRHIPEKFVRRQVPGVKLSDQLTKPLPLRIIGGTIDDVPRTRRRSLEVERDPQPHNGVAAELFASDIVAAQTRRLESRSEAFEKDLFKISEALDLRGAEIDRSVQQMLASERARLVRAALKTIDDMTLTVIDGDFPRDVLARENLTFAEYHMPLERSNREHYDANTLGQSGKRPGTLVSGNPRPGTSGRATGLTESPPRVSSSANAIAINSDDTGPSRSPKHRAGIMWLTCLIGFGAAGGITVWRFPERKLAVFLCGGLLLIVSASMFAGSSGAEQVPSLRILVKRLGDPSLAEQTVEQIVTLGDEAVLAMIKQSRSRDTLMRGWAIVCLGRIGGDEARQQLRQLQSIKSTPALVKTWSAAALITSARSETELLKLSTLVQNEPALSRPFTMAIRERLRDKQKATSIEALLEMRRQAPALAKTIAEALSAEDIQPQLTAFLHAQETESLLRLANEFPGLARLVVMEYCNRIAEQEGLDATESRLAAASRSRVIAQRIGKEVISEGPQPLIRAMLQSKSRNVRRQAAGYLASLAQLPDQAEAVPDVVVNALKFEPTADQPPWHGGPLFIPGLQWKTNDARALAGTLIRWHLWADEKRHGDVQRQINNNLQSVFLARVAGYAVQSDPRSIDWLKSWKSVVGENELKRLLAEQGLVEKYSELLPD